MATRDPKFAAPLEVNQVDDFYSKKNFQALKAYFLAESQLDGFRFFDIEITAAKEHYVFHHNLGFTPRDIITTRMTGAGTATFNYSKFTDSTLDITTTGAVRIRCFVGTYSRDTTTENEVDSTAAETAAAASASTTDFFTAGMCVIWMGPLELIPTGWLLCDGSSYAASAYPALYAKIGVGWGSASAGYFNVPTTQGLFLRGVSGSSTNDPDKATRTASATNGNTGNKVGTYQADEFFSHTHTPPSGTFVTFGSGTSTAPGGPNVNASPGASTTAARGGNETRPKNVNVYYIIKT